MENIVDITLDLINNSKTNSATTKEIMKKVKVPELKALKPEELESTVITDLSLDGRFLKVKNKWCLKDAYTMDEIINEQYRSIGDYELVTDEKQQEDVNGAIEMAVNLDDYDQLEADDAISIDSIEEYNE